MADKKQESKTIEKFRVSPEMHAWVMKQKIYFSTGAAYIKSLIAEDMRKRGASND